MKTCVTSNREVSGDYVSFLCPQCGKETIVRSLFARKTAKTYSCSECGFVGP